MGAAAAGGASSDWFTWTCLYPRLVLSARGSALLRACISGSLGAAQPGEHALPACACKAPHALGSSSWARRGEGRRHEQSSPAVLCSPPLLETWNTS